MWNMEPVSISAAAIALAGKIKWKALLEKCAGDAATDVAKAGKARFLRFLQPGESEKIAKRAVLLFSEEFLKELEDKSPLSSALPAYQDQLKQFLEIAGPEIVGYFQPDVKTVDLTSVSAMWLDLKLDPLPEDFDWQPIALGYARAIRQHIRKDPALRDQLAIALQEDSHDFEQRFDPGFDLSGYRDFLRKKCSTLQLSALHTSAYDRRIGLWSVFVPQSARESVPVRDIPHELRRQLRQEGHLTDIPDEAQLSRFREAYQNSPVTPIFEILARQRLLVLLGDPGSGKTSLLKYLALQWAENDQGSLPLWIDLKEYGEQPIGLKQHLESGKPCFGLDARKVEEQLRNGQATLYLDGLDEIFDARKRANVIEQVTAFSARYPQAPVVLTSRIIGYEPDRLRNAGFAHATLEDFDDEQVFAFLQQWHAVAEEDPQERTRLQNQLRRAVETSRAIRELAGNPLLLTMMAILNRNQELPRNRVELYREASRVLLHEWDASRSLLPTDTFARQEKEALLRELAGEMQQTRGGLAGNLIHSERLRKIFREFLKGVGISDSYIKAEAMVQQLTDRNFILCVAGADRFAFVHRTFLEYFCADWFVNRFQKSKNPSLEWLKDEAFGQHWQDEKWHEVLHLIAGMVGEEQAGELIQFLMSQDGRAYKFTNLMIAAGCLNEVRNRRAIQQIDHALQQQFMNEVICFDPPYYYEQRNEWEETGHTRAQGINWLGSLWKSKDTCDWLLRSVEEDRDRIIRWAAVQELARGWKDDPDTLLLLHDRARSDEDENMRWAVLRALAQGWKDDPIRSLLRIALARMRTRCEEAALQELAYGWKNDPSDCHTSYNRLEYVIGICGKLTRTRSFRIVFQNALLGCSMMTGHAR